MTFRLLDLFSGAGGAAMGYHLALEDAGIEHEIVGVDNRPMPRYPFMFVQGDAMTYPLEGFDFIHASPPCQAYIQRNKNLLTKHPKLIAPMRERLLGRVYVIENVLPEVLNAPWLACGTAFGLPLRRHRYFEAPFLTLSRPCHHWGTVAAGDFAAVYARGGKGHRHGAGFRDAAPKPAKVTWAEAMGIDWMTSQELTQAIPPAYTRYLLARYLEQQR